MAMTEGGAYLPCLNTSCKSHGKSHPNCKCYPGLAAGGEVDMSYCSKDRVHSADCEYFADGGEIPASGVSMDASPQEPIDAAKVAPDGEIPDTGVTLDSNQYTSPGQQAITAAEGLAQGVAGPVATAVETHPVLKSLAAHMVGGPLGALLADQIDTSPEAVAGRAEANPMIHGASEAAGLIGSMMTGTGEAGLIAKGGKALIPEATSFLGKVGSNALRSAFETGLLTGGDEITKAMVGQGDPSAPVSAALAHVGASMLFGGGAGGLFGALGHGVEALGASKLGNNVNQFLAGIGAANSASKVGAIAPELGEALEVGKGASPWFQRGVDFHEKGMARIIKELSDAPAEWLGAKVGSKAGDLLGVEGGGLAGGYVARKTLGPILEKLIGVPAASAVNRYAIPAILKVLSGGAADPSELLKAFNYSSGISKGIKKMSDSVESLFKTGSVEAAPVVGDTAREKLRKYIAEGKQNEEIEAERVQQDAPAYAEGGEVSPPPHGESKPITHGTEYLAKHYPDQNIMLQAARGRVNGYLNSIRPLPHQSKLPYDTSVEDPAKEKSYNRALDIANNPLSVMAHVKNGTITPEHMMHLTSLYPEVHQHLVKALTERITKGQLKGEKMPYHVRQSASLFLGAPLDSTMSPESIRLIQSTFMPKNQQPPADKGAAPLEKGAQGAQTSSQALAARQQRSR